MAMPNLHTEKIALTWVFGAGSIPGENAQLKTFFFV